MGGILWEKLDIEGWEEDNMFARNPGHTTPYSNITQFTILTFSFSSFYTFSCYLALFLIGSKKHFLRLKPRHDTQNLLFINLIAYENFRNTLVLCFVKHLFIL